MLIAWGADTVPETVQLINELLTLAGEGFDLRDAVARPTEPAADISAKVTSRFLYVPEKSFSRLESRQLQQSTLQDMCRLLSNSS